MQHSGAVPIDRFKISFATTVQDSHLCSLRVCGHFISSFNISTYMKTKLCSVLEYLFKQSLSY